MGTSPSFPEYATIEPLKKLELQFFKIFKWGDSSETKRSKAGIPAAGLGRYDPAAESQRAQCKKLVRRKRCFREHLLLPAA